jgi:hypothetical protein
MNSMVRTFVWVGIFSIAMAALESAVVVYLRALYYPGGFTVAFKLIDEDIMKVELLRELATLIMLLSVGYLAGKSFKDRVAYFCLAFAIWDIFYYAWLKVLIDWPSSVMEWDILFLIPFTWLGPVLAPLLCSVTMILLALVFVTDPRPVHTPVWGCLVVGSLLILYSFMEDYGRLIIGNNLLSEYPELLKNPDFLRLASEFLPQRFNWLVFSLGELLLLAGIYIQYRGGIRSLAGLAGVPRLARNDDGERTFN